MPNGYGQVHHMGQTAYAHRIAWELAHGSPPDGYVLHACDNRKCVNPEHLRVGTFQDNMDDMTAKKRHAFGSRSGRARIDEAAAVAIRSEAGTQAAIAKKFGVSQATVSMVRAGKIWRHV